MIAPGPGDDVVPKLRRSTVSHSRELIGSEGFLCPYESLGGSSDEVGRANHA